MALALAQQCGTIWVSSVAVFVLPMLRDGSEYIGAHPTGVVLGGEEVVPRFRVICPDGEWTVFVPLPDDIGERHDPTPISKRLIGSSGTVGRLSKEPLSAHL